MPIAYTLSLGYFLQVIFGGELFIWIIIGTLIVSIYSIYGGFRGVVYSDLIQFGTMIIGVFLVILFSLNSYGGLNFLKANLPATHFELTGTQNISQTLLWGFIALGTLVNPGFHQRVYAANNNKTAKIGILIATLIWLCFDLCTTFGGMYARAVLPNIDPNSAYLTYAMQLLPSGLKGFFLAAILATILSTLDSFLFIAGTTLSYDFKIFKNLKTNSHKLGIILASLLSILIAMLFNDSILTIWKTVGSFNAACILLPLMLGLFKPKLIQDKTFHNSILLTAFSMGTYKILNYLNFIGLEAQFGLDAFYIGVLVSGLVLISQAKPERH